MSPRDEKSCLRLGPISRSVVGHIAWDRAWLIPRLSQMSPIASATVVPV